MAKFICITGECDNTVEATELPPDGWAFLKISGKISGGAKGTTVVALVQGIVCPSCIGKMGRFKATSNFVPPKKDEDKTDPRIPSPVSIGATSASETMTISKEDTAVMDPSMLAGLAAQTK